jgi:hypothetical protein
MSARTSCRSRSPELNMEMTSSMRAGTVGALFNIKRLPTRIGWRSRWSTLDIKWLTFEERIGAGKKWRMIFRAKRWPTLRKQAGVGVKGEMLASSLVSFSQFISYIIILSCVLVVRHEIYTSFSQHMHFQSNILARISMEFSHVFMVFIFSHNKLISVLMS